MKIELKNEVAEESGYKIGDVLLLSDDDTVWLANIDGKLRAISVSASWFYSYQSLKILDRTCSFSEDAILTLCEGSAIVRKLNVKLWRCDMEADMEINGYKLVMTCSACPEQYDVFDEEDNQVGYLRLRHGYFRADYPDCGGVTVYAVNPEGDGVFEDDEREYYLTAAILAIKKHHKGILEEELSN